MEGRQCDRCKENKYDRQAGCKNCQPCYNLVQDAANEHRAKLRELENVLNDIANSPTVIDDLDFENKLNEVQGRVTALQNDAKYGIGTGGIDLSERLSELTNRLQIVQQHITEVNDHRVRADVAIDQGHGNKTLAEEAAQRAREELQKALEDLQTEGASALQRAMEKSDQFGQQNKQMSEISQEARYLAQE